MKIRFALLATALVAGNALAETTTTDFSTLPALSKERLSGSLTAAVATNYAGRGYVVSHSVAGGNGVGMAAVKLSYDVGQRKSYWTLESTIAYKAPFSGHTLYGNPRVSNALVAAQTNQKLAAAGLPAVATPDSVSGHDIHIGEKNIENEFAVVTAAKYTRPLWNVSAGHDFVHGGLLGVMAKHFRGQGASCVNELFVAPEWTPAPWFSAGIKTSLSIQGIEGWWFEPYMTFKAPIIGTPEDVKVAGVLTFAMSATAEYFNHGDFACKNGSQAFWIQFSTPWFVKENFIITPSVSFNWLGKGGMKANEISHVKAATGNSTYIPFREFGVVGTLSATYTF